MLGIFSIVLCQVLGPIGSIMGSNGLQLASCQSKIDGKSGDEIQGLCPAYQEGENISNQGRR